MTGGGPGYSTTTMEFLVYQTGFNQSEFGTAALYGHHPLRHHRPGGHRAAATDRSEGLVST